MPGYVIVQAEVLDEAAARAYAELAGPSIEQYGGRYVVAGMPEVIEGEWPGRVIVLEFPDLDRARQWYESPEYTAARRIRADTMRLRLVFAAGPPGS